MHSTLLQRPPVLSLAPDSIASLGELDANSLSDLWGVFTKCKDSLQNGRRLENLSWRLWFDSGRKEASMYAGQDGMHDEGGWAADLPVAGDAGWSDPEWTETTDSASESEGEAPFTGLDRPHVRRTSTEATTVPRDEGRRPAAPAPTAAHPSVRATRLSPALQPRRPSIDNRGSVGGPFDRRSTATLTGGSLQRMITGLTTLPAIVGPAKARSVSDVYPIAQGVLSPSIPARTASAPDTVPVTPHQPARPPPSPVSATKVDAPTQTTPSTSLLRFPVIDIQGSSSTNPPAAPRVPTATCAPRSVAKSVKASPSKAAVPVAVARPEPRMKPSAVTPVVGLLRRNTEGPPQPTASTSSFEPRSLVKGFDTTVFDNRPRVGSIAPPSTPAPAPRHLSASPPPSAMKSTKKAPMGKKIFFISSPTSDSEDDSSPRSRSGPRSSHGTSVRSTKAHRRTSVSPLAAETSRADQLSPPVSPRPAPHGRPPPPPAEEDDWDDDDDDDASSGWGSEYSTESDTGPRRRGSGREPERADRPQALFAKRPSQPQLASQLKPRPPGLLSQLFHPGLTLEQDDRRHSSAAISHALNTLPTIHTSKSAGVLTEQLRTKSFMRGAPAGTEMESSSEEEDSDEDGDDDGAEAEAHEDASKGHAVATALARHQRQRIEAAGPIAPPQTPRTTRRAMLSTELSESLRRNLLWERQTRNRLMGGGRVQPSTATAPRPAPPPDARRGSDDQAVASEGPRAPHPSPATRTSSPVPPMVRRHTTGTGLYLAAETAKGAAGESDEDQSDEEERGTAEVYGSVFTHGVHHHGW